VSTLALQNARLEALCQSAAARPAPSPFATLRRAGREAFLAGRIPRRLYGAASSPLSGVIGSDNQ